MTTKTVTQWIATLVAASLLIAAMAFIGSGQSAGIPGMGPPGGGPGGPPGGAPGGGATAAASAAATPSNASAGNVSAVANAAVSARLSVQRVNSARYAAVVSGYAEAEPRYQLALAAAQSGLVETVSSRLAVGERVARGETLATLENSSQSAAVAAAKQTLADAKLTLLQEQRQAQQARAEWQSSGLSGEPASELVLREPQLAAAKAAVANATATLAAARVALAQTTIKAPFDAMVTSRSVSPGQFIGSGSEIAGLFSTDALEFSLYLDERDWPLLPQRAALAGLAADIHSLDGSQHWQGQVTGAANNLDGETRQRALRIALGNPFDQSQPLLPGSFVEIRLAGEQLDDLWQLPSSARSQQGKIWYIVEDNRLASFSAEPLFSDGDAIYIRPPQALRDQSVLVVRQPLNSYIDGMTVEVQELAP